jgi:hypothetical protein
MCDSGGLRQGGQFYRRDISCEMAAQLALAIEPYARLAQYAYCADLKKTRTTRTAKRQASAEDNTTSEGDKGNRIKLRLQDRQIDKIRKTAVHECDPSDLELPEPWSELFNSNRLLNAEELESGLEFHVVQNPGKKSLAILFRGTDFSSGPDWRANLHWITRFLPGEDQYDIIERLTGRIFAEAEKLVPAAKGWQWLGVGHSLGGGLATHMAYANCRFFSAIVFDPSPVVASEITHGGCFHCSPHILRIYERGEALAYVRSVNRILVPNSENTKEFALSTVSNLNPVVNHSMKKFDIGLSLIAQKAAMPFDIGDSWGWPVNEGCRDQCGISACVRE